MMSNTAIRVEKIGKRYKIGVKESRDRTFREAITDIVAAPWRRLRELGEGLRGADHFWALRDISFDVSHGEVVGIIGRNGAGKSTLLKILSRITEPTEGRAVVNGRVGSLLEVGTGFHPDLTGRENVFLNGAILGMKRTEITRKFDEIVAFAEIDKFLDTPVKRYSSGMYVRLAFAVAAHLDPEILIVDEVLAVGDAAFQKKCLGKMSDVAGRGRTVLFVSHNTAAVSTLTHRCVYLENGGMKMLDRTHNVIARYMLDALGPKQSGLTDLDFYRRDVEQDAPARFRRVWINSGEEMPCLKMGDDIRISMELETVRPVRDAVVTVTLRDSDGHHVSVLMSWDKGHYISLEPGRRVLHLDVHAPPLSPGVYYANFGFNQTPVAIAWDVLLNVPLFSIDGAGRIEQWLDRPWGSIHWDNVRWATEAL